MRKYILLFFSGLLILSCKPDASQEWPETLKEKRSLLVKKKQEIEKIQSDVERLSLEIRDLEPQIDKEPAVVNAIQVKAENFERFASVQGSVVADKTVNVSSETGGRIIALNADEGQPINRGQLIAKLDMETLNNQIKEVGTSLDLAKTVFERQERLWKQNIGSEIQYLQAKNNVERLESTLTTLKSQLSKANVYAPISGVVEMKFSKQGEVVGPGMPIVTILDTRKLKVVVDVPESYLGKLKRGDRIKVKYPSLGEEVNARVSMLGRTIDPTNRTFAVEAQVGAMGGKIKPNLLAEIEYRDYFLKDAISVPTELMQEEVDGRKYVLVASQKEGKTVATKQYIKIGEAAKGRVIVTEGLSGGDQVITAGFNNVSAGDPITILQ